jgi:hypothetical protein
MRKTSKLSYLRPMTTTLLGVSALALLSDVAYGQTIAPAIERPQSAPDMITQLPPTSTSTFDPGPNAHLFANPKYQCTANRYLSPIGNDNADGTSESTAWATLGKANSMQLPAGTCVTLSDGTYVHSTTQVLNNGGNAATPTGYLVYKAKNMGKARIQANATASFWHIISLQGAYYWFDGLEFDGNNNAAQSCVDTGVPSKGPAHHVWVTNSTLHGCGLNGISFANTEYLYVIHNLAYNNSSSPMSGLYGSGISVYQARALANYTPTGTDKAQPAKIVISDNISRDNFNPQSGNSNSDGNGIIVDDWRNTQIKYGGTGVSYKGGGLVTRNWTYHNGGKGVHSFLSESVEISYNYANNNNWDTHNPGTWRAEISVQEGADNRVHHNTAVAVSGAGILRYNAPYMGRRRIGPNTWNYNTAYGANNNFGDGDSFADPTNIIATSPLPLPVSR